MEYLNLNREVSCYAMKGHSAYIECQSFHYGAALMSATRTTINCECSNFLTEGSTPLKTDFLENSRNLNPIDRIDISGSLILNIHDIIIFMSVFN